MVSETVKAFAIPNCSTLSLVYLLFCVFAVPSVAQASVVELPLTTISSVIQRQMDRAPAGHPVTLHAEITYVDAEWRLLFVRDATGSIFVLLPPKATGLQSGDLVQISGKTARGDVGSNIVDAKIRVIGKRALSMPRRVALSAIEKGLADSDYVLTEGVIRPGPSIWNRTSLTLVDGEFSAPIIIPRTSTAASQSLIGSRVWVRGVAAVSLDQARRAIGYQLFVQSTDAIHPQDPHWKDAFSCAVVPISRTLIADVNNRFLAPVHVRGKLLWKGEGTLIIGDTSASIEVHPAEGQSASPGATIEAIGFPHVENDVLTLHEAQLRVVNSSPKPSAVPIRDSVADALRSGRDGDAVRISGKVIRQSVSGGNDRLLIEDHGRQTEIVISTGEYSNKIVSFSPGTLLDVSGILRRVRYRRGATDSIEILLDSPAQITIRNRVLNWRVLAASLFAFTVLSVIGWNFQLRRTLRAKILLLRAQIEHEIQLEDRYRRLVERNLAAVFSWRPWGEITHCNPSFARMLGYDSPAELVGRSYWSLVGAEDHKSLKLALDRGTINGLEINLKCSTGESLVLLQNITRVEAESGTHFETTALDITQAKYDRTELKRARDAAQKHAEVDAVTGLPNRRRFTQLVSEKIEAVSSEKRGVALLFLDLDGFKEVNDTFGHMAGDLLLKCVGDRLRSLLLDGDELCRVGGDEFAILLSRLDSLADPDKVALTLLRGFERPFPIGEQEVRVTGSIGISSFPSPAPDYSSLLHQADSAMYVAKRAGRNRAVLYNHMIGKSAREKTLLLAELKGAAARREIHLHFQPEFSRSGHHLVRFEALARWNNRVLGAVSPAKFIPIAEESGLILELGVQILEMACKQAVDWKHRTMQAIPVAVNISAVQLRSESFVKDVLTILKRTGLPPSLLELEMTESVMLEDVQKCREKLAQLSASGIALAIDDFGTGYSSLSYLPELPFDRLKIARSFLEKIHRGRGGEALIRAVISVAHNLRMSVVVEGIETQDELTFVQNVGADELQGYLLGKPGPDPCSVIEGHIDPRPSGRFCSSVMKRSLLAENVPLQGS